MPRPQTQHLVIFARLPRLGQGKKRLARDIGPVAALAFYRGQLMRLLRGPGSDPRWTTWLAITPDTARARRLWRGILPSGVRLIPQGRGGLGQRMARLFHRIPPGLPPGPAVIIGSDIPGITPDHIAQAFRDLGRAPATLGPAPDGGYWLIGLRRLRGVPYRIFRGVRWSSPYAYKDTVASLPRDWTVRENAMLEDIDTGADYTKYNAHKYAKQAGSKGRG